MARHITVGLLLALLIGGVIGTAGAQGGEWQVGQVESLENDAFFIGHAFQAPDGRHLAYHRGSEDEAALCSRDVTTGEETCVALPDDFPQGWLTPDIFFQPLSWSPDGTRLAVVGWPYRFFKDTDLWIVDFAAGTVEKLVEDAYEGNFMQDVPSGVIVDVQPAWSPDGTQIAVERTVTEATGESFTELEHTTISVIDASTGEVRDLSLLPGNETYEMDAGTALSLAWSPDGAMLAVALRHVQLELAFDGIWLVDVATGDIERLVSIAQAADAVEDIAPNMELVAVGCLNWSPDGANLLFCAANPSTTPGYWPMWINLNSRDIQVLPVPDGSTTDQGVPLAYYLQASWSPDGSALLTVVRHLSSTPGDESPLLDPAAEGELVTLRLIDLATGDMITLGRLGFKPLYPFTSVWAATGDVLAHGYHLTLARE